MDKEHSADWHVTRYLESLVWDGEERIETLLHDYLGAQLSYYDESMALKMLLNAIYRAFNPGFEIDTVLVLIGPQGCEKSSFVKKLAKGFYSNTFDLKQKVQNLNDLQAYWFVELDAYIFEKQEVKEFAIKTQDIYEFVNNKVVHSCKRRFTPIIMASNIEYLGDSQLNHRCFFPINCGIDSYKTSELTEEIIDQVWAEAMEISREFYAWF